MAFVSGVVFGFLWGFVVRIQRPRVWPRRFIIIERTINDMCTTIHENSFKFIKKIKTAPGLEVARFKLVPSLHFVIILIKHQLIKHYTWAKLCKWTRASEFRLVIRNITLNLKFQTHKLEKKLASVYKQKRIAIALKVWIQLYIL